MAYTSWSVVFGEQPSASKWNIIGTNMSGFNDGTAIGAGAILPNHLKAAASTANSWAWDSYTPTTTTTGATIGNSTTTGKYIQSGKTVTFEALFTVGSTANFGTLTNIIITTPTTMASSFAASSTLFGSGAAVISAFYYHLGMIYNSSTSIRPVSLSSGTNGRYADIAGSTPAAWGIGSTLFVTGTYESA